MIIGVASSFHKTDLHLGIKGSITSRIRYKLNFNNYIILKPEIKTTAIALLLIMYYDPMKMKLYAYSIFVERKDKSVKFILFE